MGFNSLVLLMNDGLDQVEKDQDFGKKITDAIDNFDIQVTEGDRCAGMVGSGNHANVAQVISCQHADIDQLVTVGQNTGRVLGNNEQRLDEDIAYLERKLEHFRRRRDYRDAKNAPGVFPGTPDQ